MICRYNYKGHWFKSEDALNDFLLENNKFLKEFGDVVFLRTAALNTVFSILNLVKKDTKDINKKYKEWKENNKVSYNEDGDESFEQPPYIGVNKFLSGLRINENLLFPEFRENEYWNGRFSNWKLGQFTKDELQEFGFYENNPPKITDPDLLDRLRKQMTHRWEILAKTGSAIHDVLKMCFEYRNNSYPVQQMNEDELYDYVTKSIEAKSSKFLNENAIKGAIKHAKLVYQELKYKFGDNVICLPEFAVSQTTNVMLNGTPTKLMGIIDLLVIDGDGKVHIIDYKTSVHSYSEFGGPKRLAYSYLLAVYQRMLAKYGINTNEGQLLISPLQITGFKKDGDAYTYDGVLSSNTFIPIGTEFNSDKIWANIDEFMPAPFELTITTQDASLVIAEAMSKWFPNYTSELKTTRELVVNELKARKLLEPDENGVYKYPVYLKGKPPITAKSESEFVDKVLKYKLSKPADRIRYTGEVKRAIKQAINNGIDNADWPPPKISNTQGSTSWLKDMLSRYTDGNWEVVDNDLLETYGIIALKTKDGVYPRSYDFVRVSTNSLTDYYRDHLDKKDPLRNRKGLTGTYEPDVLLQSKSNSLMVDAINGNIELMETMLVINLLKGLLGYTIGNILVVNPVLANGIKMSNEELLYCFNELNKHDPISLNNIGLGDREFKFASKYDLLVNDLNYMVRAGTEKNWHDDYAHLLGIISSKSDFDKMVTDLVTVEDKIKAILKLIAELQNDPAIKAILNKTYNKQSDLNRKAVALYNDCLMALAQLRGINFRQQIKDHAMYVSHWNVLTKGLSGSRIDNPGNLDSETLNLVTKMLTEAYLNTRDRVLDEYSEFRKLVLDLKKEKGYGLVRSYTVGNEADLYSNLYKVTADGNFLFKNPREVLGAERKLLEYALYHINKRRMPEKTDEQLKELEESDDLQYYQVPLARGGADSVASTNGILSMMKSKFDLLNPHEAWKLALEKVLGIFNTLSDTSEENEDLRNEKMLYQMTNYFDGGEGDNRVDRINDIGILNFEHNLESLLLKHSFAYAVKDNVNTVFPMIKAAMVHIGTLGAIRNTSFTNDESYLTDYIKNKVKNESIVDPTTLKWMNVLNVIKSAASKLTLAIAPVLFFYQHLSGLWNSISLVIRKPDGTLSFTFRDYRKAWKIVYSEMSHYSDNPTIPSAINELFGINDMDMNTYTSKIGTSHKGFLWNVNDWMYKFSSRPDFYNRMTIFVAKMIHDGCYDALSIKDGKLVYDWKKDKRFEAFANGRTNDPKYNELKTLYYVTAQQFVRENTKNPDGTDFQLDMNNPMPLPRIYTNLEAESIKSLGDNVYGYYSHEKKSLILSSAIGSMWLQFKTYWSAKKDLYLQSGGVRLRGKWVHYSENVTDSNGLTRLVKYYYQVDSNGNTLWDEPPLSEDLMKEKGIPLVSPFMQWLGQWLEGIMVTLANMVVNLKNDGWNFKKTWNSYWNNGNDILRLTYRDNIKHFAFDLSMFMLGGTILGGLLNDWLKDLLLENKKNKDFSTGLMLAAANVAVMSVKGSFLDFNAFLSVGTPVGQWTPFAFEWAGRTWKTWSNVVMHDEDFWDGVVKTSGGLRLIKPALDAIKPDIFRTEREGGTFGVEDK